MKKSLIILIILLAGCSQLQNYIGGNDEKTEEIVYDGIPVIDRIYKDDIEEKYQVKTKDKRNIVKYEEVDWLVEKKDVKGGWTGEYENKGKIIMYDFITDIEVKKLSKKLEVKINQGYGTTTVNAFAEEILDKRTSSSEIYKLKDDKGITLKNKNGEEYKTLVAHSNRKYVKKDNIWYKFEKEATTTLEAFDKQIGTNFQNSKIEKILKLLKPIVGLAVTTNYLDDVNNSKYIASDAKSTFILAHDATTGTVYQENAGNIAANGYLGGKYYVRRADIQYSTSALPDVISISDVKAYFTCYKTGSDNDEYDVVLLDNTNNANIENPVIAEDFNDFPTVSIGSRDLTDLTATGLDVTEYVSLTSYSVINKTGNTRLGIRLSGDLSNSTPTGYNALRTREDAQYLNITYTEGATPAPRQEEAILFGL